jgi:hypothetical protein
MKIAQAVRIIDGSPPPEPEALAGAILPPTQSRAPMRERSSVIERRR